MGDKNNRYDGMESSIMEDVPQAPGKFKREEISEEETYVPAPNYPTPDYASQEPTQNPEYSQQETYAPQETYESYAPSYDSDMMIEISEQVFQEKMKKIQKLVDDLVEFKTLTEVKINDFSERLKRIETMIDSLQISILDKVGSYGKNLENTKKEMAMMQDSFRKVMNSPKTKHTK